MSYLALCDETGEVGQVIVIPDDLPDPIAYVRNIGLMGTVVAVSNEKMPSIGMQHVDGEFYPIWRQLFDENADPVELEDVGYPEGVVVFYNGQLWTSIVAANIWEPGVFGWSAE